MSGTLGLKKRRRRLIISNCGLRCCNAQPTGTKSAVTSMIDRDSSRTAQVRIGQLSFDDHIANADRLSMT